MANTVRQPFDPHGKYVARRGFTCNGHSFTSGDDFPWRKHAINTRKLFRLYDLKFIDVKGGDIQFVEEEVATPELLEEETVEEIVEASVEGTGFIFDPEVHTLDNPSKGEYFILKAGEPVLRISRKEWKRLEGKEVPETVNPDRVISEE